MSENAKKARSYVKKALKLNPDHIGAQLFLIDLEKGALIKTYYLNIPLKNVIIADKVNLFD
mgnify:CR=1 FL=1